MKRKWILFAPLAILAMLLFAVIGGELVLHLWNWLMPGMFGWRQITFWQAVGVLVLCRILFGGSRWRGPGRYDFRRRMGEPWRRRTPEEREQSRQGIRDCFGFGPSTCENKG